MTKRKILFKETKVESLWSIFVDGDLIEDSLRADQMDIADYALNPLWEALSVAVEFENIE
jgi:hypothetical protein